MQVFKIINFIIFPSGSSKDVGNTAEGNIPITK